MSLLSATDPTSPRIKFSHAKSCFPKNNRPLPIESLQFPITNSRVDLSPLRAVLASYCVLLSRTLFFPLRSSLVRDPPRLNTLDSLSLVFLLAKLSRRSRVSRSPLAHFSPIDKTTNRTQICFNYCAFRTNPRTCFGSRRILSNVD